MDIPLLIDIVKHLHADAGKLSTDYSFLQTVIGTFQIILNDKSVLREHASDVALLRSSLKYLNNQIKEIKGFNLIITSVSSAMCHSHFV